MSRLLLLIVVTVLCSGCVTEGGDKRASAGHIGCAQNDIEISEHSGGIFSGANLGGDMQG